MSRLSELSNLQQVLYVFYIPIQNKRTNKIKKAAFFIVATENFKFPSVFRDSIRLIPQLSSSSFRVWYFMERKRKSTEIISLFKQLNIPVLEYQELMRRFFPFRRN